MTTSDGERLGSAGVAPGGGRFRRVAISHEWLTVPGGSEKVVQGLLELYPQAEIFTSIYRPQPFPPAITSRPVHVSALDRIPHAERIYPHLLPLMNVAFESFDLSGYELVVSSHHSCAKSVLTMPDTLHVCYCHTPMRHAWEPSALEGEALPRPLRALLPPLLARLRRRDLAAAVRPDHYVANSTEVRARIRKYYRRDAVVIHPPVEVDPLLATPRSDDGYYLYVGRVVPYKRADLAVAACTGLGRRLRVVGVGRALDRLRQRAGPTVELLGAVSDERLRELLAGARGLLFPGKEDFGIVPVEAQAAGVPVIARAAGGVLDSVLPDRTGVLYEGDTADDLARAIRRFETMEIEEGQLREQARRFAPERFREAFAGFVDGLEPVGVRGAAQSLES